MRTVKMTTKGRVTIPAEVLRALGIDAKSTLELWVAGNEIRLRKIPLSQSLSSEDPIWNLIGAGESDHTDIAEDHDWHIAEGELARRDG